MHEDIFRLKNCRYGKFLYPIHDQDIGRCLDLYGEFSRGESEAFAGLIADGQSVVDVGANIGVHSIHFAKLVGAGGSVLAFEPQPLLHRLLTANSVLNQCLQLTPVNGAVGDEDGTIVINPPDLMLRGNYGGFSVEGWTEGISVPIFRLDSLNLAKCDFLKVDVEGMESSVIKGARDLITRCRPIMFIENDIRPVPITSADITVDRDARCAALIKIVFELGYDAYWHVSRYFFTDNFFNFPFDVFGDALSYNMLCFPRERNEQCDLPKVSLEGLHITEEWRRERQQF